MTWQQEKRSLTFSEYTDFVSETMVLEPNGDGLERRLGRWAMGEIVELFDTRDKAETLLPYALLTEISESTRTHLISECGDALWFATALSSLSRQNLHSIMSEHAREYGSKAVSNQLNVMQRSAVSHERVETFVNKVGMPVRFMQNPFYHVARVEARLANRYLDVYKNVGPLTASDLEPDRSVEQVIGDMTCLVMKVGHFIANARMSEIAAFNMSKVLSRHESNRVFEHEPDALD